MKKLFSKLLVLFFLLVSYQSISQPISKSEFKQLFTQGNLMILEKFYDTAAKVFLKLNTSDPSNANINYKIGICYLNIPGEKAKAIPYLENALKQTAGNYLEDEPSEKNAPEIAMYYLGQAYHYSYRFDEAMQQFKKYRDIIGKWNLNLVKEIDHWTEMNRNGKELTAKPVECTITNLGDSVNCEFADYSPVISADESMLSFTSRRLGTGGAANKTLNDEFLEDIWLCNRGPYGTWTKAKGISRTINTENNEATIGLSADGQELYVYRDDGNGDGNIYISALDGDYWNAPAKIDANNINSKKWEPSACVSADGNTIYFVSDREGGSGGRDIYQCKRLSNHTWSQPENLGPSINTPYDEDAPFIHPDGTTFFFSSTGHSSMGGFDVFYSNRVANGVWTKPINMGYPINTTDDDIYFVTSSDGRRAYYASFRPEGKGEKDIYMVSMPKPIVKSVAILVGYLKNKNGSTIPKNSLVTTKSTKGEIVSNKPNEASGKFVQSLFPGQSYEITIEANGNTVFSDKFFLPEDSSYQNLGRGFFQRIIFMGDTANLFSMKKATDTAFKFETAPVDGQILLSRNSNDPAQNLSIQLLNSQGNLIASTTTDKDGKFKFQNIPSDQKYMIKIDENDPMLKSKDQFYLANNEGKIVLPSTQEGKFFLFKHLSPDMNKLNPLESTDTPVITSAMTGKLATDEKGKTGLANTSINLLDETGKTIQKKTTDKSGNFSFEGLTSDKNYTISIDEKDPAMSDARKLYLVNQRDALIRRVRKLGDYFVFENLPSDLNKLGSIEMTDTAQLVYMKGKVLKSNNPNDVLANLNLKLVDNKGQVIQTTKTDASGSFKFDKLSADHNYTVKFNDDDPLLTSLKKAYLSNEADKAVKVIDLNKKGSSFKDLPADLMRLGEIKESDLTQPGKAGSNDIVHQVLMNPDDKNFDFVVYFPYNKKEIDISVGSFLALTEKVVKTIHENGRAAIIIAASSSSVPTTAYPSNEMLAEIRANEIKDKVRASISLKNIDDSKFSYEISKKVQGPEYKNDAVPNRKEYEKWQFVKVIVK
ncbi:MAG: hypothetical protein EPN85_13075 [Bacteroidetes bacterium]|nr:MAG: hypothetical protein EPN85_13075 [Bacteroidota bacterium]